MKIRYDPDVDVFDREAVFIERVMIPLLRDLPQLRRDLCHTQDQGLSGGYHRRCPP